MVHAVVWRVPAEACSTAQLAAKCHNSPGMTVQGQVKTVIDICGLDIPLYTQRRHVLLRHVLHHLGVHSSSYLYKRNCSARLASLPETFKIHTRNHPSASSSTCCSHCRTPCKLNSFAYTGCTPFWCLACFASMHRSEHPVALVTSLGSW